LTSLIQRSFASGEVAPALYSRTDFYKYQSGLKTLRNAYVKKHGGVENRPGFEFIGEVKDSAANVRLIPFIFNDDQTYVLEFGDQFLRVIRNGEYQTDLNLVITSITNTDGVNGSMSYTGTDPSNGDEFIVSGVIGTPWVTQPINYANLGDKINNMTITISNVNAGANTFDFTIKGPGSMGGDLRIGGRAR